MQYKLWLDARNRAKEEGVEFTIKPSDIRIPKRCPLLDVPLIGKGADIAVVDRIDPEKGFVPYNIWVVSRKANRVKGNLTLKELKTLVENLEAAFVYQQISDRIR